MKNILKKIGTNWLFLIAVVLLYLILGLWNFQAVIASLVAFLGLLKRILPILVLVYALIYLSNLFLNPKVVSRYLGEGNKRHGWVIAIIAGILSAGPIYLWYPLLKDLKSKGMRDALIATFLYNRAVKIPLLPMMIYYFGVHLVVILTALMVLFSVANGLIVERLVSTPAGKENQS